MALPGDRSAGPPTRPLPAAARFGTPILRPPAAGAAGNSSGILLRRGGIGAANASLLFENAGSSRILELAPGPRLAAAPAGDRVAFCRSAKFLRAGEVVHRFVRRYLAPSHWSKIKMPKNKLPLLSRAALIPMALLSVAVLPVLAQDLAVEKPQPPAAAPGAATESTGDDVFGLTRTHKFHLEFSADEWEAMQAVAGRGPFGGGPGRGPQSGAQPQRRPAAEGENRRDDPADNRPPAQAGNRGAGPGEAQPAGRRTDVHNEPALARSSPGLTENWKPSAKSSTTSACAIRATAVTWAAPAA